MGGRGGGGGKVQRLIVGATSRVEETLQLVVEVVWWGSIGIGGEGSK